jgi:putative addiction module component (TIGR02574 family)
MRNMSALLEELKKQTRLLTAQEKATLARILIEGLDAPNDTNVEQLWVAESQRRYEAYRRGEIEAHPGDEVMTRARNRLK